MNHMNLIQQFGFTVNAVAPVFFLVFIGIALKKWNVTNETFNSTGSFVVFRVALPALVFERIAFTEFSEVYSGNLICFVLLATLIWTLLMTVYAILLKRDGRDTGVIIQGSYRSNFAIIGMALIYNVLGDTALSKAAIILAVLMPVFNILAILVLTLPQHQEKSIHPFQTIKEILSNPLVLGAVAALPFSVWHIPVPLVLAKTLGYLSNLTLPLALVAIGGQLTCRDFKVDARLAGLTAVNKIVLMPLAYTGTAYLLGFRGIDLGVIYLLSASPTAIASFPMAEAMGANGRLAGNIILVTTLGAMVTIFLGISFLGYLQLI